MYAGIFWILLATLFGTGGSVRYIDQVPGNPGQHMVVAEVGGVLHTGDVLSGNDSYWKTFFTLDYMICDGVTLHEFYTIGAKEFPSDPYMRTFAFDNIATNITYRGSHTYVNQTATITSPFDGCTLVAYKSLSFHCFGDSECKKTDFDTGFSDGYVETCRLGPTELLTVAASEWGPCESDCRQYRQSACFASCESPYGPCNGTRNETAWTVETRQCPRGCGPGSPRRTLLRCAVSTTPVPGRNPSVITLFNGVYNISCDGQACGHAAGDTRDWPASLSPSVACSIMNGMVDYNYWVSTVYRSIPYLSRPGRCGLSCRTVPKFLAYCMGALSSVKSKWGFPLEVRVPERRCDFFWTAPVPWELSLSPYLLDPTVPISWSIDWFPCFGDACNASRRDSATGNTTVLISSCMVARDVNEPRRDPVCTPVPMVAYRVEGPVPACAGLGDVAADIGLFNNVHTSYVIPAYDANDPGSWVTWDTSLAANAGMAWFYTARCIVWKDGLEKTLFRMPGGLDDPNVLNDDVSSSVSTASGVSRSGISAGVIASSSGVLASGAVGSVAHTHGWTSWFIAVVAVATASVAGAC